MSHESPAAGPGHRAVRPLRLEAGLEPLKPDATDLLAQNGPPANPDDFSVITDWKAAPPEGPVFLAANTDDLPGPGRGPGFLAANFFFEISTL